jgi:transposase
MTNIAFDFGALVGIDWANDKHDICLLPADGDPAAREYRVLEHRAEAIDDWANGLRARFPGRAVAVCLEQRKGPLIYALSKYEHLVLFPVNPAMVARLRKALAPSGAKDDPRDAAILVDILLNYRAQVRQWVPDDPRTRELQALVAARRHVVELRVGTTNRLTANLKDYFPQALECFDSLDCILACDFLTRYPSLPDAKDAPEAALTSFFYQHGVRGKDLVAQRIALLKTAMPLTSDTGVVVPALLLTRTLVAQLRALVRSIDEYDEAIAKTFKAHPDADIFSSLPGAGPVFAPRLLAAFGSDRDRFASARALQEYTGIAPVTERSGKSTWVHWRYACSRFLRQSVVEWAGMSVRYSYWADAYYRYQREKGKSHHAAVRALAFKWLRILFCCWKARRPYDEATYLFSLRKRNSPLLKYMATPAEAVA